MEGRKGEQKKPGRDTKTGKQKKVDVELGVRTLVKKDFSGLI